MAIIINIEVFQPSMYYATQFKILLVLVISAADVCKMTSNSDCTSIYNIVIQQMTPTNNNYETQTS